MATFLTERYFKTASLCCAYFAVGLFASVIGPTILELQCLFDVTYVDVIKVLPARSSGYAVGALLAMMVALTVMGSCVIYIPWAGSLFALLSLTFIGCLGAGMIDNNSTVLVLYMWGKESQPFLQALHFCFGLGALVAPLLASPFLSAGDTENEVQIVCRKENVTISIPYAITGLIALCIAVVFGYLFCFRRQTDEHPSRLDGNNSEGGAKGSVWNKRIVIALAGLLLFTLMGLEIGMGSFITSFAVKSDNHLSQQVGAYMTSLYWFTYTSFRLCAVLFINEISITLNITLELCILFVANIFLVPFGNSSEWCLWVGIALTGIAVSTVWASAYSLLESYFPVTSGIASFLSISACLGEWVFPVIMGYAMENGTQLYLWTLLACTIVLSIIFAALSLALKITFSSPDRKSFHGTPANYGTISADDRCDGNKPASG